MKELRKTKNLRDEIKDVWRRFDQDGDGSISMRELANVMSQFGHNPSEYELRHMISQVDEDGDGRIGWQEFSNMMDSQFHELDKQEQKMRKAFDFFDLKKDHFIDSDELVTVMNRLGDQLSLADAEEMIRAADSDCDGLVSYSGTLLLLCFLSLSFFLFCSLILSISFCLSYLSLYSTITSIYSQFLSLFHKTVTFYTF